MFFGGAYDEADQLDRQFVDLFYQSDKGYGNSGHHRYIIVVGADILYL